MLPLLIDLSDTIDEFYLTKEETASLSRYVLTRISDEFLRDWEKNIDTNLSKTRNEYKKAIVVEQLDDFNIILGLTPRESKLALMLEDGASPFDIKKNFEKSSKRKEKVGGWYLTVPFRHATAGAVAEAGFSSVMPNRVEGIARASVSPLKITDLPEEFRIKGSRAVIAGQKTIPEYKHKAAIYEGLVKKNIAASENEKRSGYFTFRRVSDKSNELSWIHKGFEARKFMDRTAEELQIDRVVDMAVDEFLSKTL